jgi:type IV pilus assembly protein PilV
MGNARTHRQAGMTLIEVMVSVLILAIGLLGAAAIQLNALRYTDSSKMTSQASFVAYDMMDRIRANVDGNGNASNGAAVLASYALASLADAPAASPSNLTNAVTQDKADFATNIRAFAGGTAGETSKIVVDKTKVTITIVWDDSRAADASKLQTAAANSNNVRTFDLTSRIGVDTAVTP